MNDEQLRQICLCHYILGLFVGLITGIIVKSIL